MPKRKLKNNKIGDLSMQTVGVMVLILATILVILAIFMNQAKDGSDRLDGLKNSIYKGDGTPCIGNGLSCRSECTDGYTEAVSDKGVKYECSPVMGGTKCCQKS